MIAVGGVTTQGQIAFGGITSASFPPGQPFQPDGISGLAGLAFQPLSGFGASNWYNQFVIDYNWYDGYSMCLSTLAGGNGGVLAFGVDYSKDARFKFTPLTQSEWWNIALNDIKFGGKSLGYVFPSISPRYMNNRAQDARNKILTDSFLGFPVLYLARLDPTCVFQSH